jgi:hypothetical protein
MCAAGKTSYQRRIKRLGKFKQTFKTYTKMKISNLLILYFIGVFLVILSALIFEDPIYTQILFSVMVGIGFCVFVIVLGKSLK